jgi:UDP-N-acetylglucosamine--N-acetylmuramyl-(pentapeptide) pyrophosphoryl-undecaprenol N-acetylglucosamine transferase
MSGGIILAGGGSGGHLSPGLAVAERLHSIAGDIETIFACSDRKIDRIMLEQAGARFEVITAAPFSIRPRGLVRMVRLNLRGTREAERLFRNTGASTMVAMGGFVSIPVVRAARRCSVRVVLLNLDAVPGRANRWVAKQADDVRTSVHLLQPSELGNPVQVGFPLRRVALAPSDALSCRERLGLDPNRSTLLVTGASQGASSLNALMRILLCENPLAFDGWQVIHLSGARDEMVMRQAYAEAGVPALVTGFLEKIGLAWGSANLALSRAGANSVAEAAANMVPTLFVPYPYHRDLHQQYNAEPLVRLGGARMALDGIEPDLNRSAIGGPLIELLIDPGQRARMRTVLEQQEKVDGAAEVARLLLEMT